MLDFRVKRPKSAVTWRYQEIIVTEEYLNTHADAPNLINLDSRYEMGIKGLDVFYNGQRLTVGITSEDGIGFEEVDDTHIRLHLGFGESPIPQPLTIEVNDVIIIKEWFNSDSVLYSYHGVNTRLTKVEMEVIEARGEHSSLNRRFEGIDKDLTNLLGEGDYTIEYTYDQNNMDIIKEKVSGDYDIVKEYEYNLNGKPIKETVYRGTCKTIRTFVYDPYTSKIKKVISSSVII